MLKDVVIQDTVKKREWKVKTRREYSLQLHTPCMRNVMKAVLPADGICCIAVTMVDLWPGEGWNYVFGEASLSAHVGVFSFARYHPSFPDHLGDLPNKLPLVLEKLLLIRSLKVMVHECTHMLNIEHCIYFHCLMNGGNNLEECDLGPLFFMSKLSEEIKSCHWKTI